MNPYSRVLRVRQKVLRNRIVRAAIRPFTPIDERSDLVRLGTDYGGWWVPCDLLNSQSIVYSAGVGGDASFDIDLIERFRCHVWAFDPTPFSVQYVRERDWPPEWHFDPIGIWTNPGVLSFQPFAGKTSGSASITRPGNSRAAFDAPVETLSTLMKRNGHDYIDLLKMDIEGAEGPILDQLLESDVRPAILCVEFDQPESPFKLVNRVRRVLAAGYRLHHVELWNYTFSYAPSAGTK